MNGTWLTVTDSVQPSLQTFCTEIASFQTVHGIQNRSAIKWNKCACSFLMNVSTVSLSTICLCCIIYLVVHTEKFPRPVTFAGWRTFLQKTSAGDHWRDSTVRLSSIRRWQKHKHTSERSLPSTAVIMKQITKETNTAVWRIIFCSI